MVGALLRGRSELSVLIKAAEGLATIELVDDRFALVSTVTTCRPVAVVVPPFDSSEVSTVPLVLRLRRDVPGVKILIAATHPSGAGQPMLRAARAGAVVLAGASAADLRAALERALESDGVRHMET